MFRAGSILTELINACREPEQHHYIVVKLANNQLFTRVDAERVVVDNVLRSGHRLVVRYRCFTEKSPCTRVN